LSIDLLRQNCIRAFSEAAENHTTAAINMTPGTTPSADQYAMMQVDRLAAARAYMEACRIITSEFKKLTQPEKKEDTVVPMTKTGAMY